GCRLIVVDPERDVLRRRVQHRRRRTQRQPLDTCNEVNLGVAGAEPRSRHAEIGTRDLREAEQVAIEGESAREVAHGEGYVAHAAGDPAGCPSPFRGPAEALGSSWTQSRDTPASYGPVYVSRVLRTDER